jgi:hypothetical protein
MDREEKMVLGLIKIFIHFMDIKLDFVFYLKIRQLLHRNPKLVDLFSPEFCLRIGDTFVRRLKAGRAGPTSLARYCRRAPPH